MNVFSLAGLLALFVAIALFVQWASVLVVVVPLCTTGRLHNPALQPGVSILRPVCGLENNLEETLASTFLLRYSLYEIVFCIALPDDHAIPIVKRLMARYSEVEARLIIGDDYISAIPN